MSTIITDVDELQAMKDDLSEDYVLGNNIDASATSTWNSGAGFEPVGTQATPFTGSFDGAGYTISDLFIDRSTTDDVGLFGYIDSSSSFLDVTLDNFDITGDDYVGAFAGYGKYPTISDITVTNLTLTADTICGSIMGAVADSTISDCTCAGTLTANDYMGGFVGELTYISTSVGNTVTQCSANCTITGTDDRCGGFTARSRYATISKCFALGSVSGDDYISGFIGWTDGGGNNISDCYSRCSVTGDNYVAGFISYTDTGDTVDNCYSTGAVSGNTNVSGFIETTSATVSNCFWDVETSGQTSSDEGSGRATTQMEDFTNFYSRGWSITRTDADHNNGYPYLNWEYNGLSTKWGITGLSENSTTTRSFNIPDVLDLKGRVPKGAVVRAYRADNHAEVKAARTTIDSSGNAEVSSLPLDVDIIFHVTWGGSSQAGTQQERWFYSEILQIEAGGTGSSNTTTARSNLGLGTTDTPQFAAIELGDSADTTLTRSAVGEMDIEGVTVLMEDGSIDLAGSMEVNDDVFLKFGNTAYLGWETSDADAHCLILSIAASEGNIPVFIIGDQGILNKDFGLFENTDEPNLVIYNKADDALVSLNTGDVNGSGANGLVFFPATDEDINLLTLGVTGTPQIIWDESEDKFDSNKGWNITGNSKITGDLAITGGLSVTEGVSDINIVCGGSSHDMGDGSLMVWILGDST